jgi:clan AA aspartic protease (TIGR02281 family)
MLRWAFGYLAMAVVVAIGFAALQEGDRPERASVRAATEDGTKRARSVRAHEHDVENESAWDEEGTWDDESAWDDESGLDDESGWEDGSAPEDGSGLDDEGYPDDESEAEHESDLEYVIDAGAGGHFVIEAVVNGAPVTFLVDTGASDIVLTMADAERLGFRPENLRFTQRFATANGEVRAAPVVLREVRIGQFSLFDMPASVNEAPLRVSLLGMSFLKRLHGYGVEDGRLILRW